MTGANIRSHTGRVDRLHEVENLRRSIAMLTPGQLSGLPREEALRLIGELQEVQRRLDALKLRLHELADTA